LIICIILAVIGIITFIFGYYSIHNTKIINQNIKDENLRIENENIQLLSQKSDLEKDLDVINRLLDDKSNQLQKENQKLKDLKESVDTVYKDKQEMSQKAFENFCSILDKNYEEKSDSYSKLILNLDEAYQNQQDNILQDLDKLKTELEDIKKQRTAILEAQIREKEIKEQKEFYCLPISVADRNDIQVLERVKTQLNKPRILSMLIWSTFFQKPMTTLCNNVLGTSTICGIYKITNQIDNKCYIGQSVNVSQRWKDHAKCGLGIDTPVGNKLYKAMIEEGIWNFSWELLEECSREQLDSKEKYYIDLYNACDFGYNSNKGNGK
jgi:hypothetical protein